MIHQINAIQGDITKQNTDAIVNAANPSGFKLPAKYVIHTVGPVYGQNDNHDAELLQSCYWTSLARAEENGVTSITFPLISTGIYGYPKEKAIRVSIDAIREYFYDNDDSVILEVNLCAWSDEDYCFARAFDLITATEGEARWPSLRQHESDRIAEVEEALTQDIVTSADHRVVQAVAMRKGDDVSFLHPECVAKSWPQFWDIRSAI